MGPSFLSRTAYKRPFLGYRGGNTGTVVPTRDPSGHFPAHALTPLACLKHFEVSEEKGLTSDEATTRYALDLQRIPTLGKGGGAN